MKIAFFAFLAAASMAIAQHDHDDHGKEMTLTTLVVDTGCYMSHDTKGEKDRKSVV